MRSYDISREIEKTLIRYRAGMIGLEQARQELAHMVVMLKAYETTVMEDKLDKLEAIMEARRR